MRSTLRIKTTVLPGHRIEFSSPELKEGEIVHVLVEQGAPRQAGALMDHRRLLGLPVAERRKILSRQAELLQSEYGPDPERDAWQGGDIVAD